MFCKSPNQSILVFEIFQPNFLHRSAGNLNSLFVVTNQIWTLVYKYDRFFKFEVLDHKIVKKAFKSKKLDIPHKKKHINIVTENHRNHRMHYATKALWWGQYWQMVHWYGPPIQVHSKIIFTFCAKTFPMELYDTSSLLYQPLKAFKSTYSRKS